MLYNLLQRSSCLLVLFCLLLMAGCSFNPYRASNRLYKKQAKAFARQLRITPLVDSANRYAPWVGTTNFNLRKPNFVVLHHTAQNSCAQTLKTFTQQQTAVSAHYVICRDGIVHHMLHDSFRAWHAGLSRWGALTDVNSASIGIELDNNGSEPFPEIQISSLLALLQTLKVTYAIPSENFIGHADVAPVRKVDPSPYFPWKRLYENGFGLWYGDTTGVQLPEPFDRIGTLKTIGYDTRDSVAAKRSFALRFLQDTTLLWTSAHDKILYALQQKYR